MPSRIALDQARYRLAAIWFVGAFFIFCIVGVQSILGKFIDSTVTPPIDKTGVAWDWLLPLILPTLALMAGVLGEGALALHDDDRTVHRNFYYLTLAMSVAYLLAFIGTILLAPFSPKGILELYSTSHYWLVPTQSVVGGSIGLLFTSQRSGVGGGPNPAPPNPQPPASGS